MNTPHDPKLRLCKVGDKIGYFHTWEQKSDVIPPSPMRGGHPGGVVSQMFAIVEFTDGIERVQPCNVKFYDEITMQLAILNKTD